MPNNIEEKTPEKYRKLQKTWKRLEFRWNAIHYSLGLSATVLAFLSTASDFTISFISKDTLAISAGVLSVMLTFLSPAAKRKGYAEACNILRIARLRYEAEEKTITTVDLNDAVARAQETISRS